MQLLKDHLLSRLLGLDYNGDERSFTAWQRNGLQLTNIDTVVHSKILCVNYITYNIRRDHDSIGIACGDVIMTASRDNKHLFWYARVLKAFHLKVSLHQDDTTCSEQTMEILWVCWLGVDLDHKWEFKVARLPKVGFVPDHPDYAPFGFLDLLLVLRGCHLIPSFSHGCTNGLSVPGPSVARLPGEVNNWAAFYVHM